MAASIEPGATTLTNTLDISEKPQPSLLQDRELEQDHDADFVTWNGVEDVDNPYNWAQSRKWLATLLMSGISLMTLMSSSMIAPALDDIARDLSVSSSTEAQLALSAFVLAYAFAPMFIGPLSEIFGRIRVLQTCNAWFLIWTIICGFAHAEALMVVARLLSGIGGGAIFAIGDGFLSDCWKASERGKSFAICNVVPLLGPALGPLIGGYMTATIGWRWIFWVVAMFDVIVLLLSLCFLRETHARTILYRRMQRIKASTGNEELYTTWDTANDKKQSRSARTVITISCTRAFHMLATQPILQFIALYQA
ncbi:hypothetical protein AAFC00_001965 [Neodothiora populina]|uniref:Major facilitator superfamily (MFS) profile domain-containing protein n=1 Tax=Neodothiora populina TaxID=2781224 RepID=A0ABR3PRQ7_9PEZI